MRRPLKHVCRDANKRDWLAHPSNGQAAVFCTPWHAGMSQHIGAVRQQGLLPSCLNLSSTQHFGSVLADAPSGATLRGYEHAPDHRW